MTILTPRAGSTPWARADAAPSSAGAARRVRRESGFSGSILSVEASTRRPAMRSHRLVADDADLVAVGVPEIGAVIVRMIMRAQPRRAFVPAAARQPCLMGGVDGGTVGSLQAYGDAVAD